MFMVKRGGKWFILMHTYDAADGLPTEVCVVDQFEFANLPHIRHLYLWWNINTVECIEFVG